MSYKEVKDLSEVDPDNAVDFRYGTSLFIRDHRLRMFIELVFNCRLKAAYSRVNATGDDMDPVENGNKLELNICADKFVLFKENGEAIYLETSDEMSLSLHRKEVINQG
jgi:hypothetical protein